MTTEGGEKENPNIPQDRPQNRNLKDFFGGPPVQSKITEPDPNYAPDPIILRLKTPQEAQEILFRESAKRLAAEGKLFYILWGLVT